MTDTNILYWTGLIWLSGCISGVVLAMLVTLVGLKTRRVTIKER